MGLARRQMNYSCQNEVLDNHNGKINTAKFICRIGRKNTTLIPMLLSGLAWNFSVHHPTKDYDQRYITVF